MKIDLLYIILLLSPLLLCCNNSNHSVKCLQIEQQLKGDTLVFNKNMDGLEIENFNFILATEKYLQGITDEQMDLKLWVEIYTKLDSSKRKVDAFVFKSNKSKENFIDFVSWIQNENPTKPNDRSKPYIIHPITGKINRIKDGIVIRKKIDDFHAEKLIENAEEINEWNEYQWDENSIVNFSVDYWNGKRNAYHGNCSANIPKTISKILINFGINQNMSNKK